MDNKERTLVEMTPEEKAQFEAFQKEQARKAKIEAKREQRKQLQEMTDSVMAEAVAELMDCNKQLVATKLKVMETFSTLMELRKEVNEEAGKKEQDTYIQLGQLAEKSGNEEFQEGMRIIREAYRPTRSKLFIRCSTREPEKEWEYLGLGIGEV